MSQIAREAIAERLVREEHVRALTEFAAEARAAYTNPDIRKEALSIAEELSG